MNWWLDLGRVFCIELIGSDNLADPTIPSMLFDFASDITQDKQSKNPYFSIISKTLLNNPIVNGKKKHQSEEDIKNLFTKIESEDVYCSFCEQKTTHDKESIAGRKWIVSGGWEESPLFAGGGSIPPRICLNCRRLSILASFKAYDLFIKNNLPFIIYNPDLTLYRKLINNLLLRKDLSLNFERSSSVFLSLGSVLVYPVFDRQGNISSFDLRPLLPKASLMLMNLSGLLRTKGKEQYILDIVEKHKEQSGAKLIIDFLKNQSKLNFGELITAFYAFLKAYKGGVGMTKTFFELGNKLGNNLGDKAYSVALKLYKSLRDSTQLQKQLIGAYIYLKEPMPPELTRITESEENSLAFIMGIMSTIKKEG